MRQLLNNRPSRLQWVLGSLLITSLMLPATVDARDGDTSGTTLLGRAFSGLPHRVLDRAPQAVLALDSGIEVYDTQTLASPTLLGDLSLPSTAWDVALIGTLAYVANGESGLVIVDLADPNTPTEIGALPQATGLDSIARGITVAGGLAYIAESAPDGSTDFGLRIVDVVDPMAPFEVGYLPLTNGALTVSLLGQTALVGIGSQLSAPGGVVFVDVSDPSAPAERVGSFIDTGLAVNRIALDSNVAYLAVGDRLVGSLMSVDASNPAAPAVLGRVDLKNGAMDVSLVASRAYVAARESGVIVVDITTASTPTVLGKLPLDELATAVDSRGATTLVGLRSSNGRGGMSVVDTLSPTAMTIVGTSIHAEATAVAAKPGLAFMLERDGLHVFDTSTMANPIWLAAWSEDDGDYSALHVAGPLAAVAEGMQVHLIDISNPATPTTLGSTAIAFGTAVRVYIAGRTLYVVTGRGLETFDITSPASPSALGSLRIGSGMGAALTLDGNGLGYLLSGGDIHVLDVSNPAAPSAIGQLAIVGDDLRGAALADTHLLVAGRQNFYTIDVTTPTAPTLSGMLSPRPGFDVVVEGAHAIVAGGDDGLRIVDISTPTSPTEVAFFDTSGEATTIANEGPILYLSTMAAQHWTMFCDICDSPCVESWPSVTWNSLRATVALGQAEFSWTVGSGSGDYNLHRTADKTALPNLYTDAGTVAATASTTSTSDSFDPGAGGVAHYRVFAVGVCDGLSHYP